MPRQKKTTPDPAQKEFDFPRAKRRDLLKQLIIPSFEYENSRGNTVKVCQTSTMKDFLLRIEEKCGKEEDEGWFVKMDELRVLMTASERTISRAIAACEKANLLNVTRSFYKGAASHYLINWCNVRQMVLDNPATEWLINPFAKKRKDKVEHHAEKRGLVTHAKRDVTPDKLSFTPDKLSFTPDKLSFTPDKLSSMEADDTSSSRARGLKPCINHESNQTINHGDETESWAGYSGWPWKLEREHFQNAFTVQLLFEHALDRGWVREPQRIRFFELAYVSAMPHVNRPGGYFTATLKKAGDDPSHWVTNAQAAQAAVRATCKVDVTKEQIKSGKLTEDAKKLLAMYAERLGTK